MPHRSIIALRKSRLPTRQLVGISVLAERSLERFGLRGGDGFGFRAEQKCIPKSRILISSQAKSGTRESGHRKFEVRSAFSLFYSADSAAILPHGKGGFSDGSTLAKTV